MYKVGGEIIVLTRDFSSIKRSVSLAYSLPYSVTIVLFYCFFLWQLNISRYLFFSLLFSPFPAPSVHSLGSYYFWRKIPNTTICCNRNMPWPWNGTIFLSPILFHSTMHMCARTLKLIYSYLTLGKWIDNSLYRNLVMYLFGDEVTWLETTAVL